MRLPHFVDAVYTAKSMAARQCRRRFSSLRIRPRTAERVHPYRRRVRSQVRRGHRIGSAQHDAEERVVLAGETPAIRVFGPFFSAPGFAAIIFFPRPRTWPPCSSLGLGSDPLVSDSFRLSYLRDAHRSIRWAVFPATPPASRRPSSRGGGALQRNNIHNWVPSAPSSCGGHDESIVFWLNTPN